MLACALLLACFLFWVVGIPYLDYRYYSAQGVVTSHARLGFSITRDIGRLIYWMELDKREFKWDEFLTELSGG